MSLFTPGRLGEYGLVYIDSGIEIIGKEERFFLEDRSMGISPICDIFYLLCGLQLVMWNFGRSRSR
jgi:hypothetical protein